MFNLGDILVVAILTIVVALASRSLWKSRKAGGGCGGCSGCSGNCSCCREK